MPDGSAALATTKTDTKPHAGRGALDRELFCSQLQRLLLSTAAELGQRSNHAQVVATIERGGVGGGAIDNDGAMVERLNRNRHVARQVRELEQRWRLLSAKHQALALAHYVGTLRAHPTIRTVFGPSSSDPAAQQGSLAGVVLYRWQQRQAKGRFRDGASGAGAKLAADLAVVRAWLTPIETELGTIAALLDSRLPELGERPERPAVELVWRKAELQRQAASHRAKLREWRAPLRVARKRRQDAAARRDELKPWLRPLQAEQARLCAELATAAAVAAAVDDESALVVLCRSGGLDLAAHLSDAESDVRALHRAWYATAPKKSVARAAELRAFKNELWG